MGRLFQCREEGNTIHSLARGIRSAIDQEVSRYNFMEPGWPSCQGHSEVAEVIEKAMEVSRKWDASSVFLSEILLKEIE